MRLVQFLIRLVIKSIGVALVLLLVLAAGLWVRGRFFANDEVDVEWAHHAASGQAGEKHGTHFSLGSTACLTDTQTVMAEAAAPSSQPATQPATQPSAVAMTLPCGTEVLSHKWETHPGYIVVGGPADAPHISMLGFEYGSREANGEQFRWMVAPYWFLMCAVALPVVLWTGLYAVAGRRKALVCNSCHHDLRQPIHRCPECGAMLRKPLHVV